MAMFTAYFDASGHPDDKRRVPALFVSGFVSTAEKWLKFETSWLALLKEFEITPPFHMTDFEAGIGPYAAWKHDETKREAFRMGAILAMKKYTNKGFSAGVVVHRPAPNV